MNINLGNAHQSLCDFRKLLQIAKEVGFRVGEGVAYGCLGTAYHPLGDSQKAIEYYEKHLEIAIEVGDRVGEGHAYGGLGNAYHSLCLLYTSPSPRDQRGSRMPSSA